MLPNFSMQILLALKQFGNDAQARTSIRKQNPEPEDFSVYSTSTFFDYSNMKRDVERKPKDAPIRSYNNG